MGRAVHAEDENYAWVVAVWRPRQFGGVSVDIQGTKHMRFDFAFQLLATVHGVAGKLFFYGVENLFGCFHAEVGGEQRGFHFFEHGGIDLAAALGDGIERVRKGFLRFADGFFEALEERGLGFSEEGDHKSGPRWEKAGKKSVTDWVGSGRRSVGERLNWGDGFRP